jgi:hypothetical protein
VDMRLRPGVARALAEAVSTRNEADPHSGAGGSPADAQPRQGGHLYGPQDGSTDPNTRSLS